MDDWFLADLTLIWHANPVYTNIHWYHYLAESRYNGGEVVTIAPDYSPSAIHADYHLPVKIGTDVALGLAMGEVGPAPRGTLAMGNVIPALEGTFIARLADGTDVEVTPVFELLKERLKRFTPERAARARGIPAA